MARILLLFLVVALGIIAARRILGTFREGANPDPGPAYRPHPRSRGRSDSRRPPPPSAQAQVSRSMLSALRDALSGGPLDPDAELFRCADCQSFYSVASVRALALDNGARCINCGSMHRIGVEVVD